LDKKEVRCSECGALNFKLTGDDQLELCKSRGRFGVDTLKCVFKKGTLEKTCWKCGKKIMM